MVATRHRELLFRSFKAEKRQTFVESGTIFRASEVERCDDEEVARLLSQNSKRLFLVQINKVAVFFVCLRQRKLGEETGGGSR